MSNCLGLANMERDRIGGFSVNQKSMQQMQKEVDEYIGQYKEGYFTPLAMMARLTEELGELAREINHTYGEKPKKASEKEKAIEEELGDVLFVLICLANSLNINLDRAHDLVMDKFQTRDKNRWTKIKE
ncbi:nucleotide pyrophosphohydrolase [Metabacillus arenae]|uniref:Nucleotide pyrophosphohydrolase n=1 Tax=Metabacillus arenae TaxID=2771434 RepID=A0A926NKK6_9BACI|nr:nucleotide pyrophosphohydrolase [Metabacillus arenae]MBD1381683.1 nucleotide pyrophosphohydrolase [Metabacillus arenae]